MLFGFIALSILGLTGGAFAFRHKLGLALLNLTVPRKSFEALGTPPPPDYENEAAWAALPGRVDSANVVPKGETNGQDTATADVFFIHPTTYFKTKHWNAPFDDKTTIKFLDKSIIPGQASAFNACARIYAPRYRQNGLGAFIKAGADADKAFDVAYSDVVRAFDWFLKQTGNRPFIIAGHSQGSFHMRRLLRERIAGTLLADRLVVAYPIGYWHSESTLKKEWPGIPLGTSATQTKCYALWNTLGPKGEVWAEEDDVACTNPLTWTTDNARADNSENLGSASLDKKLRIQKNVSDAHCKEGVLRISGVRSKMYRFIPQMGKDNYHPLDYSLFYMNLRRNAAERVAAFDGQA